MPKIALTDKDKVRIELYINFLLHNTNPCENCSASVYNLSPLYTCCECERRKHFKEMSEKYQVDDLLECETVKEYVDTSVKRLKTLRLIESLKKDVKTMDEKIYDILNKLVCIKEE
jgi:hypothetical protein